jgi:LuxR family maltose regulon positive regulatory protein
MGYGKTALLSEWNATESVAKMDLAWVSCGAEDNINSCFVNKLNALAGQALTSEQDFVLCLDNYDQITNPNAHKALEELLKHQPDQLHIVILSRTEPPLPLPQLIERGQLLEITVSDLRFTDEEARCLFFETTGVKLSQPLVDTLMEYTEGWPAALQVEAMSVRKLLAKEGTLQLPTRYGYQTITRILDEIVASQPAEVQRFLLVTSILDRMCAPLCDALLSVEDERLSDINSYGRRSSKIFEGLSRIGFFIEPLDAVGHWYRYHRLLRDYLREKAKILLSEELPTLHRAASAWFKRRTNSQRLINETLLHLFLAKDWEQAAQLVEQNGIERILKGDLKTVLTWTQAFPESYLSSRPLLALNFIWSREMSSSSGERLMLKEYLQKAESGIPKKTGDTQETMLQAYMTLGLLFDTTPDPHMDADHVIQASQRALEQLPEDHSFRPIFLLALAYGQAAKCDVQHALLSFEKTKQTAQKTGAYAPLISAAFYELRVILESGRLKQASILCQKEQERCQALRGQMRMEFPDAGWLDIMSGCILLEQGRMGDAEIMLLQGLNNAEGAKATCYHIAGLTALCQTLMKQDRIEEALYQADKIGQVYPDYRFLAIALRTACLLRQPDREGQLEAAAGLCQTASPLQTFGNSHFPGIGPLGGSDSYYQTCLIWAQAQTASGRPEAALLCLGQLLAISETQHLTGRVIALLSEKALALAASGKKKLACGTLRQALKLAIPEGYVTVFNKGPLFNELLRSAAMNHEQSDYVTMLLRQFGVTQPRPEAAVDSVTQNSQCHTLSADFAVLTEREQEILRMVAEGLSNKEIAYSLHLAVTTVKTHIYHIMLKLGVNRRTQIIAHIQREGQESMAVGKPN